MSSADASDKSQPGDTTSFGFRQVAEGARRFESFEYSYAGRIGLGVAIEYALEIGLENIAERVGALAEELRAAGVSLRLRTPTIVRPTERADLDKWLALELPLLSGHLGLVAELSAKGHDVIADYGTNCFNPHTAAELFRLGAKRITASVELTTDEIYGGYRHTFRTADPETIWHPYVGVGLEVIRAHFDSPGFSPFDDDASALAGYGRLGMTWALGERMRMGLDFRQLFGTNDMTMGTPVGTSQANTDNQQVAFTIGYLL